MKRVICFMLCLILTLALSSQTQARGRKRKGKDPKTVISKRGKLIFEDDFSGKELEWVVEKGDWRIVKKALATKSAGRSAEVPVVSRPFATTDSVIFQLRVLLPPQVNFRLGAGHPHKGSPGACISSETKAIWLGHGHTKLAASAFAYKKPRWVDVLFETIGGSLALTVDGKTIKCQIDSGEVAPKAELKIWVGKDSAGLFAIDDVKVWEALPKDEDEEKGKKKRKRR